MNQTGTIDEPAAGALLKPNVLLDWSHGGMSGAPVRESAKTLGELKGLFFDHAAFDRMDSGQVVYSVRWWPAFEPGTEGGLFWGVTLLQSGRVGDEYFMTHGHFHANRTRAEFYAAVSGQGLLLRVDEQRKSWAEEMLPGSLHSIDGRHAHRVINTGEEPLIFWASWGSDAGYDYATIRETGFGLRVLDRDGQPAIVPHE